MKKILPLLLIVALAVGCNKEKTYKDNLDGTWEVYKYLYRNVDKSHLFDSLNYGYTITFTSGGQFTEKTIESIDASVLPNDTSFNVTEGSYSFKSNDEKIVLTNADNYVNYVTDTNGNVDTLYTPYTITREYTIFNLTRNHVQLLTDSSELYLRKPE